MEPNANAPLPAQAPELEPPKKYIRTFAGDMEIVQKGGTPELAPFSKRPASPNPPASPPPSPPNAPLKTYAGDFSERMKKTHASTATVLAAEQDRTFPAPPLLPSKPPRRAFWYLALGATLLVVSAAGAYITYTRYLASVAPVALAPNIPAPIAVDERQEISGGGQALIEAVRASAANPLVAGAVRLLFLTSADSTSNVFSALSVGAPEVLLRNIRGEGGMAGVVSVGGEQSPFFILAVSSYSATFSGMLSWEKEMPRDLGGLFPFTMASSTTATSTPSAPASFITFTDASVESHDVRVYRDASGREALLYGYWNQETLIIARNTAAFVELVGRLSASRAQ